MAQKNIISQNAGLTFGEKMVLGEGNWYVDFSLGREIKNHIPGVGLSVIMINLMGPAHYLLMGEFNIVDFHNTYSYRIKLGEKISLLPLIGYGTSIVSYDDVSNYYYTKYLNSDKLYLEDHIEFNVISELKLMYKLSDRMEMGVGINYSPAFAVLYKNNDDEYILTSAPNGTYARNIFSRLSYRF